VALFGVLPMEIENTGYIEAGKGPKVILIHSSVAGAKQWRNLMETLAGDFHVIAINLFGYGKTRAWESSSPQSLENQARLIEPFLPTDGGEISIVGHSFGGCVAMKAAALFKTRVRRLVLIEPNPFYLLAQHGHTEAYQEVLTLQDAIKLNGKAGTWEIAAKFFADYWTGAGSWDAMPDDRKSKFVQALKPNFHEWDAVMNDQTSVSEWERDLPKDTTLVSAKDTVRSITEIVALLEKNIAGWSYEQIDRGGHMAAMTKPDLVNPIVVSALK